MEEKKDIRKPVGIVIEELKQSLMESVQTSGLHISIVSTVVSSLATELKMLADKQTMAEYQEYEKNTTFCRGKQ